jgi:hypothetical protein
MRQIAAIRRECENVLATDWVNADKPCNAILDYVKDVGDKVLNFDASLFIYDL